MLWAYNYQSFDCVKFLEKFNKHLTNGGQQKRLYFRQWTRFSDTIVA